ncbi:hypothetical protein ADIARSV_3217 [Arcticibacter svalbardensis MN12-7]|uniref:Uncharacterized protein n=1 Tax=Arcticibacter svalbardensis MN12-7 TaxID=1150600 RepID=R9GPK2_9SPHI|nr:hypothetical protein ADIARSV_3217 [Arcticibacter svalbardensis MN12-7]
MGAYPYLLMVGMICSIRNFPLLMPHYNFKYCSAQIQEN